MDEESWTAVQLNVLLNCDFLCLVGVQWGDTSVELSETESHTPEYEEFHNWPVDVEEHSTDEGVANVWEPPWVEVSNCTWENEWEETCLFIEVGVNEEQQEGSVEELHDEDSVGDQFSLLWLSVITNVDDKFDDEESEDIVDSDDHVLHCAVGGHALVVVHHVCLADFNTFNFNVHHTECLLAAILWIAEALESTS